ncbi:hypothetical protein NPIL_234891 [Nephila pilipes]|uniref:Uncharacterized protein n=1 Tax=Nephila pilipes TaxID=299642 RepID=A0A8X6QI28_NEPPI|nr:hypothetical protein NPIL_234891 [Nephila pilipes]
MKSFVASLKRSTSHSRKPELMNNNCGTNYVNAQRVLKHLIASYSLDENLQDYLKRKNIRRKLNSPAALHQDGQCEDLRYYCALRYREKGKHVLLKGPGNLDSRMRAEFELIRLRTWGKDWKSAESEFKRKFYLKSLHPPLPIARYG